MNIDFGPGMQLTLSGVESDYDLATNMVHKVIQGKDVFLRIDSECGLQIFRVEDSENIDFIT